MLRAMWLDWDVGARGWRWAALVSEMEGLEVQIYVSRNEGNEMAKMKVEAILTEVMMNYWC